MDMEIKNLRRIISGLIESWSRFNNVHCKVEITITKGFKEPEVWIHYDGACQTSGRSYTREAEQVKEASKYMGTMDRQMIEQDQDRKLRPEETKEDGL